MTDTNARDRTQQITGHEFQDSDLLQTSLTHSSIATSRVASNERLEFLGDAVLGMVVCDELYCRFDNWLEGELTKVKSFLVSRRVCADIADEIGLTEMLVLGNGIDNRATLPLSLRAAVLEAVIGAVFIDGGLEPARAFIRRAYAARFDSCADSNDHENYKSYLQQYVQRLHTTTPRYETLDEQGPDHSKCFEVCVVINGDRYPSAWGPTKKHAEQEAARRALEQLGASFDGGNGSAFG